MGRIAHLDTQTANMIAGWRSSRKTDGRSEGTC
jgi:hypothetical protein